MNWRGGLGRFAVLRALRGLDKLAAGTPKRLAFENLKAASDYYLQPTSSEEEFSEWVGWCEAKGYVERWHDQDFDRDEFELTEKGRSKMEAEEAEHNA